VAKKKSKKAWFVTFTYVVQIDNPKLTKNQAIDEAANEWYDLGIRPKDCDISAVKEFDV